MNAQFPGLDLKGWLAGCFAATATLFVIGFIKQILHPDGLTPASLAAGLLVASVHLAFIIMMSAIPAAVVIWATRGLGIRSVLVFAPGGAVIGWFCQGLITPWPDTILWQFVFAGLVAGFAYWFVAVRQVGTACAGVNRAGCGSEGEPK
jgi:hypothetical protein